jgi:hypothetical protein
MVNNNLVPVDFLVMDVECNASCPIILGRPFLQTVGAIIDMREGTIKYQFPLKKGMEHFCHGFVNRSAIEVGVWQFVEVGEYGGAIRDGGSMSLPSFRSRNGGETLRPAIIHYMATSARLQ